MLNLIIFDIFPNQQRAQRLLDMYLHQGSDGAASNASVASVARADTSVVVALSAAAALVTVEVGHVLANLFGDCVATRASGEGVRRISRVDE